jgi:hypothetical protein
MMASTVNQKTLSLGPLRLGLFSMVAIDVFLPGIDNLLSPSNTVLSYPGWHVFTGLIAPVMAPILVVVLFIDVIMTRILAADETTSLRARYLAINRIELLIIGLMLAFWVPYFLDLGNFNR